MQGDENGGNKQVKLKKRNTEERKEQRDETEGQKKEREDGEKERTGEGKGTQLPIIPATLGNDLSDLSRLETLEDFLGSQNLNRHKEVSSRGRQSYLLGIPILKV